MADKKIIVLVGSSNKSWEDAVRNVVQRTAESVGKIDAIDVVHQSGVADVNGEITEFRATVHISFEVPQA